MPLTAGIIGLPNVGKSTIFNALCSGKAAAENYPFCTIEPNHGMVSIPDARLARLSKLLPAHRIVPAFLELVDIAGLVRNASKGEGLGNQFLAHIRDVDAVIHVVRCFDDPDVVHVEGSVDTVRDASIVETELLLADLDTTVKALDRAGKAAKSGAREDKEAQAACRRVHDAVAAGTPARAVADSPEIAAALAEMHLLTAKPVLFVANVDEAGLSVDNAAVTALCGHAAAQNALVVKLCGKIEAEIAELPPGDRAEFLQSLGLTEPGLEVLARAMYETLGLQTFFTCNENENHAWPIPRGIMAPKAGGKVHTDFERGFIKAEVFRLEDLEAHGTPVALRSAGKVRLEGHDYVVQDGDVMLFKFSV
jgi:hypothetical protein